MIQAIPLPVMGGGVGGFSLITWLAPDLGRYMRTLRQQNLIVAAITLVLGTGTTLKFGIEAGGDRGTATFGAIPLYAWLSRGK